MTKADRIRHLKSLGFTNAEIAHWAGCNVQYVRVVLNQRTDKRGRKKKAVADRNYCDRHGERRALQFKERYHSDPEFRDRHLARNRERYHASKAGGAHA